MRWERPTMETKFGPATWWRRLWHRAFGHSWACFRDEDGSAWLWFTCECGQDGEIDTVRLEPVEAPPAVFNNAPTTASATTPVPPGDDTAMILIPKGKA